ncbi:hypothetical protein [Paraconexibacter sp.]|uniref:hypothetical protein n=1 Tax=Paraconexibacter sp. TaxID=2949640 RepID=UPI00356AED39
MSSAAADRVRTLLLRADNLLKNTPENASPGSHDDRALRARTALREAADVAADPSVDERIRDLVQRRLDALDALGDADAPDA